MIKLNIILFIMKLFARINVFICYKEAQVKHSKNYKKFKENYKKLKKTLGLSIVVRKKTYC